MFLSLVVPICKMSPITESPGLILMMQEDGLSGEEGREFSQAHLVAGSAFSPPPDEVTDLRMLMFLSGNRERSRVSQNSLTRVSTL